MQLTHRMNRRYLLIGMLAASLAAKAGPGDSLYARRDLSPYAVRALLAL